MAALPVPAPAGTTSSPPDTHFRPRLNQTLKDGRFTVLRKLGEGITSSTWLVRDSLESSSPDKYAAAKILTAEASKEPSPVRELEFLEAITKHANEADQEGHDDEGCDYLPGLTDYFLIHDHDHDDQTKSSRREHLCLVQTLYSTSVSALRRSAPTQSLPVYMVRSIIYMTLQALRTLHSLKIVHTDVKLDNILFSNAKFSNDQVFERYLSEHPTNCDADGFISTAQPIPNDWTHETIAFEAEKMTVALIDYGHSEWDGQIPLAEGFSPIALRPPEVLLSAGISTSMDIWAIGCLTFELLVGRWLFLPEDGGDEWSVQEDHLAKMMELTGTSVFPKSVLDRASSSIRAKYFTADGTLIRIPDLIPVRIEDAMANYKIPGLKEQDINEASDFIRACLNLDAAERKTADELLKHPFAQKAWSCE